MAMEVEFKFLVTKLPPDIQASFVPIRQGYLANGRNTVRVRTKGSHGFLTIKSAPSVESEHGAISRLEFEYEIPLADAQELLALCPTHLEKRRAELDNGIELDIFEGSLEGLVLAEYETTLDGNAPPPPEGWEWRDVSRDDRFSNRALAENGLPPGFLE